MTNRKLVGKFVHKARKLALPVVGARGVEQPPLGNAGLSVGEDGNHKETGIVSEFLGWNIDATNFRLT